MAEEIRKRSEIEEKYKWDLTHIYAADEEWEKDYQAAETEIGTLSAFDGHVAENPKKAIITVNETVEKIMPIYEYAFLRKETDNADSTAQGLKDRAMRLYVTAMTVTSFLEPELLEMPEEALKALAEDPEMRDYDAMLRRLLLSKPHTLPKEQERLIAMMGEVAEAPESIFSALSDADMKFPPVKMPDGSEQELTEGNYSTFIRSDDRDVRRQPAGSAPLCAAEPQQQPGQRLHDRPRAWPQHALLLQQHEPAGPEERLQPVCGGGCLHVQRSGDAAVPDGNDDGAGGSGIFAEPPAGTVPDDGVPPDDVRRI